MIIHIGEKKIISIEDVVGMFNSTEKKGFKTMILLKTGKKLFTNLVVNTLKKRVVL